MSKDSVDELLHRVFRKELTRLYDPKLIERMQEEIRRRNRMRDIVFTVVIAIGILLVAAMLQTEMLQTGITGLTAWLVDYSADATVSSSALILMACIFGLFAPWIVTLLDEAF